jgi:hypothetical protein
MAAMLLDETEALAAAAPKGSDFAAPVVEPRAAWDD